MSTERCSLHNIMIVAGEASGDVYGGQLAREMSSLAPDVRLFGIGGQRMREAGVTTLVDSADMAVVGVVEVVRHFNVIAAAFLKLKRILLNDPPDLLILIDYPGFNLRLAKVARKAGVQVLYYISPQIWAWRQGRVREMARLVDHMAVIFPFEVPFYQNAGIPVSFVGHPLYDLVRVDLEQRAAVTSFGLDPARQVVGLFPGSRRSEIRRMLPAILEAASLLRQRFGNLQFALPLASTLSEDDVQPLIRAAGLDISIARERIHDLIRACDAIMTVSGTVTLEIALVGTPMVVAYKLAPLTYQLAKRLVKVDHIALCNIVAGERVVRELIQDEASPRLLAEETGKILSDQDYSRRIREGLSTVREKLRRGGAAGNVARLALEMVKRP